MQAVSVLARVDALEDRIGVDPARQRQLNDVAGAGRVGVEGVHGGLDPRLKGLRIDVACDVDNPLLGERGASAVFGPQKGASEQDVGYLDAVLARWARLSGHGDLVERAGAGAAGGLGFALMAFLDARLEPGIELVVRTVGLMQAVTGADLVLTGEGSVDAQTLAGKTPAGVAGAAARQGVPTVVVAGRVRPDGDVLLAAGCVAVISTSQGETANLAEVLRAAPENAERAAATVMRLWTHRPGPARDR